MKNINFRIRNIINQDLSLSLNSFTLILNDELILHLYELLFVKAQVWI